jgi:hypothetical protein
VDEHTERVARMDESLAPVEPLEGDVLRIAVAGDHLDPFGVELTGRLIEVLHEEGQLVDALTALAQEAAARMVGVVGLEQLQGEARDREGDVPVALILHVLDVAEDRAEVALEEVPGPVETLHRDRHPIHTSDVHRHRVVLLRELSG